MHITTCSASYQCNNVGAADPMLPPLKPHAGSPAGLVHQRPRRFINARLIIFTPNTPKVKHLLHLANYPENRYGAFGEHPAATSSTSLHHSIENIGNLRTTELNPPPSPLRLFDNNVLI